MATTASSSPSSSSSASSASGSAAASPYASIAKYVQLAGAGAFLAGAVLSLHHYAIGICFLAGAAAYYAGKKLKGS